MTVPRAILRDVVDAALAEKKRDGKAEAGQLIDRKAHEGCRDRYRDGDPAKDPWQ